MKISIINRSTNSLPAYQTEGSAGMDLMAFLEHPVTLKPMDRAAVPTGLYIELPAGYEAQVRPRSGLALKKGLGIPNAPGTIDSDYRGEIKIIVINLSDSDILIENGERIAQLVISKYERAEWNETGQVEFTSRNEGGFGSTGIR